MESHEKHIHLSCLMIAFGIELYSVKLMNRFNGFLIRHWYGNSMKLIFIIDS